MRAFYSIISVLIRPEIDEKISLGLLMITDEAIYIKFSKTKLSVAKALLPSYLYLAVKNQVVGIQNYYHQLATANSEENLFKYSPSDQSEEKYISYLSKYKTTLVVFSEPLVLSINVDQQVFDRLYEKHVDEDMYSVEIDTQERSIERFRTEFVPTVRSYYTPNFSVGPEILPGTLVPLKFDLVGKNGEYVFVKSIDLERRTYNVEHDVNAFFPLQHLSPQSSKFLVSKEPDKKFKFQHQVWKNLRGSRWFDYIDVSEADILQEYAEKNGVAPLLESSSQNED